MKDEIKDAVIASSRGIADDLNSGNDVSQRMGRILNICMNVLESSDVRFRKMSEALQDVYEEMAIKHNQFYEDLGGQIGSGDFVEIESEEVESKTGLDFSELIDGISEEGFMKLQLSLAGLRTLITNLVTSGFPQSSPDVKFAESIQFSHWLTLMSVYDSSQRERVLEIITKYEAEI